jgi:hypothetical protein
MKKLPFWFDTLDLFYYLPEHTMISYQDAVEKYGISTSIIAQCKAWWNTNIPMEGFMPILTPVDDKDAGLKTCLMNFAARLEQRVEGREYPTPPDLEVRTGILILDAETKDVVGYTYNHPNNNSLFIMMVNEQGFTVKTFEKGEIINRNPNFVYWDMIRSIYV